MDGKKLTLMKKLTNGDNQPSLTEKIPGIKKMKAMFGKANSKQAVDLAVFAAALYVMYYCGNQIAEKLDNQVPTEKQMLDMMKQMQPP